MDERIIFATYDEPCVQAGQRSGDECEEVVFDADGYAMWVRRAADGTIMLHVPVGDESETGFADRPATADEIAAIEWAVLDDNGMQNDDLDVHVFADRAALEVEIAWRREHANVGQYDRAVTAAMEEML